MKSPLAALLWRSLRVYQVFGANTDVGKTIFTTLLARTARKKAQDEHVAFLKPVSTGAADEADDRCEFVGVVTVMMIHILLCLMLFFVLLLSLLLGVAVSPMYP